MIGGHLQVGDLITRNFARRLMLGRIGSAIIAGDGVGHPRERLILLGIKDMEDRADQHRMRGLLPMVAPLEHAFGVDQDVGDILHIAHVIGVGSGTTASSQFRPIATARLVGDRTAGFWVNASSARMSAMFAELVTECAASNIVRHLACVIPLSTRLSCCAIRFPSVSVRSTRSS
ncbi:hypothetical protein MB02_03720 [Croceicoccus estronivorus]|nr:hypothetical protein MB02_03720 [Croceicoccus estronivorus]